MAKSSIVLLTSTAGLINITGQPVKGPGYFGYSRGILTTSISINNFIGRFYLQASLSTIPTDKDWFPLWLEGQTPYAQFPFDPNNPTGEFGGDTGNYAWTLQGNIVWIRAVVDRSYIPMVQLADVGTLQTCLLNY